jgi:predicted phage tail protein
MMIGRYSAWIAAFAVVLMLMLGPSTALAARDRTPPTKPTNFRVTAKTPFSASLAWNPSSDNSGNFSYVLASTSSPSQRITLPKTATSYSWNTGLYPRNGYTFIIYAVDAAGNASASISTSTTLPADTVPPAAPVLSVTDVGSAYVSLAWTAAQDDGPYLFYQVLLNGSPHADAGTNRSITIHALQPGTAYTFSVRARDYGPNFSPPSNSAAVTTDPTNPNDTTPPTTPTNLRETNWCDEVHLNWDQSTDDFDAQSLIRYDVYVNGVLSDTLFGSGGKSIVYGNPGELNTFEVIASDTAGNRSAPAMLAIVLCG